MVRKPDIRTSIRVSWEVYESLDKLRKTDMGTVTFDSLLRYLVESEIAKRKAAKAAK